MLLTWWLRIQRYSVQRLTPSAEPWPLWLPFASFSGSLGCGMVTIPVRTQMKGCRSKPGQEEKRKVHAWTWDVQASALFKLQMHSSSLKVLIYMEMEEKFETEKIIMFYKRFFSHGGEIYSPDLKFILYYSSFIGIYCICSNEAAPLLLEFGKVSNQSFK